MTHTLAAVFETRAEANRAKGELIHNGYDRAALAVSDSGSVAGTPRIDDDASILHSVRQMFSELLGREHADRHVYAEALNRGHVVLTVATTSLEEADRAADIVEDFNPIDIDEHETMWRASGWTGAEVLQRSGMRIYPRETPAEPNQDSLDILRGDDTDDDAVYFRTHWQKTFSYTGNTYQEFDPAYRYGQSMAGNPGYKDKPWEHAEPELRSDWESKNPQSSWDKFKDAVREGWDRVTK